MANGLRASRLYEAAYQRRIVRNKTQYSLDCDDGEDDFPPFKNIMNEYYAKDISKKLKDLRLELKKLEDKRMDMDTFLETVRRYTNATAITKRMVAELIQYIEVYPAVKEDGVTNQRVTIHYNCIGAFEVPDRRKIPERDILFETRKGVALSYAPAQIAI